MNFPVGRKTDIIITIAGTFTRHDATLQLRGGLCEIARRSRENNLSWTRQGAKLGQLGLIQPAAERAQYGECDTSGTLGYRRSNAPSAAACSLHEGDIGDQVDHTDVELGVGIDLDEEGGRIKSELKEGAGRHRWLEVGRRHRTDEIELGQDDDWKLLRATDDEHLSKVVGEDGRQGGVEGCGEWGGTETGSEVCVVTCLDCQDAACGSQEGRIVCEQGAATEVCTDADRSNHVGEVDKGSGVGVGESVGAGFDWREAGIAEDGADGLNVDSLVLDRLSACLV